MVEPQASVERLERLTGMLRRRGIILPAFEIMGVPKGSTISDRSVAGFAPRCNPSGGITGSAKAMWSKFRAQP